MSVVAAPEILEIIGRGETLPSSTFREMGFQSNREVVATLFFRGEAPPEAFSVPLLEGRNVGEFNVRRTNLFLQPNEEVFTRTKCRLKSRESYEEVDVLVRQTAAFTIAARSNGARFRNSLIGAFGSPEISADLLVGLLNSALYRALHVARQRDARQAAFPQVKIAHLRKLPLPPQNMEARQRIERLSENAHREGGLSAKARKELDETVFRLFHLSEAEAREVISFLGARCPGALRPSQVASEKA